MKIITYETVREESRMNRTEFSAYFGIPYKTVENWDRGNRSCPEYLVRLMHYKLTYDAEVKKKKQ